MVHQARHGSGARGLDHELGSLEQHEQSPGERLLRHRDELVDVLGDGGEANVARAGNRDAVGHGRHRVERDGKAGLERARVGRRALGLDADHLDRRVD
jgi:hypothetical protein